MAYTTSLQDRLMIQALAETGWSDPRIAQQVGWSVATVRKWRRRARSENPHALVSQLGRPAAGALSAFAATLPQQLRALRSAHPGWGPKTLRAELAQALGPRHRALPSRASLARWLKQEGLTRPHQRHWALPTPPALLATAPHEVWQLDARGHQYIAEVGVVALLNVQDVYSRVKVMSYPCVLGQSRATRHPTTADYQLTLRLAFREWGLPDRVAVDHDSVFYDNLSPSPFPTRLHLWLVALGVELSFARKHRPTDQAIIERGHQTWYHQVLEGQRFGSWEALRAALDARRRFLNEQLGCASLHERPPLRAYPAARQPRRPYRPEAEATLVDMRRVYTYLGQGRWFRLVSTAGTVAVGGEVYSVGRSWARREVSLSFDPADQHLIVHGPDGVLIKRVPIQGLSPTQLMGEASLLGHRHPFQLALPFSPEGWQVIRLCETFPVTT